MWLRETGVEPATSYCLIINKYMKLQHLCQQCNTSFFPRNDSPGIFCSKSCTAKYHNARRQRKIKTPNQKCLQCNADIFKPKKFCNSSCAASFNNSVKPKRIAKTHECPGCGIETKNITGKYCTKDCYIRSIKKYTPEEAKLVRKQLNREVSANYRARVRNQTPSEADRKAIKEFYINCPIGYEVDHIMPISKGGLHDLSNLQYLTIQENRKKSNKIL